MFGILAKSLGVASRLDSRWDTSPHREDHDRRTRAEKERDAQERRRMLRQTGMM